MTEAELLDALAKASVDDGGEGFTVQEMRQHSGKAREAILKLLKAGIAKGLIRTSRRRVADITGRVQSVPSYVFLGE